MWPGTELPVPGYFMFCRVGVEAVCIDDVRPQIMPSEESNALPGKPAHLSAPGEQCYTADVLHVRYVANDSYTYAVK